MKNIIIGTAGHVDHGKTMLIKALTGIDTDRLKEEKKRGITIELGFAHMELPNGESAGIVDVPGHEKFIKNMLAGAGGIDLVLLVVAADEGFMPQTREHMGILSLLDIKNGIIVLTKTDLVDQDWMEIVTEDIKNEVKGTFLENAPMVPVSAYTGEGIETLKNMIASKIEDIQSKDISRPFRMPVDRVFSVEGFGTVVTGTLIEGSLSEGDDVTVYPSGTQAKVRRIQVHGNTVKTAFAGQRVAVNLAALRKTDIVRGDTIAFPGSMEPTLMLDTKLRILKDSGRVIENGTRLHFYHGTRDILCKLVLLDADQLSPGESGYAQLHLCEKIAAKTGDHFVVRFYSPLETIGGGLILDTNPEKHKRKNESVIKALKVKEEGSLGDRILQTILELSPRFETLANIQKHLGIDSMSFQSELDSLQKGGKIIPLSDKTTVHINFLNQLSETLNQILEEYHKANPLQPGMRRDELRSRILPGIDASLADSVLTLLEKQGQIRTDGQRIALSLFKIAFSEQHQQLMEKMIKIYSDAAFSPPSTDEIMEQFSKDRAAKQVFDAILANGSIVMANPQICFHRDYYDRALSAMKDFIEKNGSISLAQFRDLLGTSRKYAVALLEYWDRISLTKKTGDVRILAKK